MLLFAMLAGTAVKVSATMPPTYDFGIWKGSGDISAYMPGDVPGSNFLKLTCDRIDGEISPINYTVTTDEDNIIVTLKEEFLKTLSNELHYFSCHFSGVEEFPMDGEIVYSTEPSYGIEFSSIPSYYTLTRLTYEGENIDKSYYISTKNDQGNIQVIFNDEEYWKTLQPSSLKAYFATNGTIRGAFLWVDAPEPSSDEEATSDPPVVSIEETTSDSSDADLAMETSDVSMDTSADSGGGMGYETDSNSKTGSDGGNTNGAAALWVLVIVVASASGCAALGVVLLKRYKSKKERD